MIKLTQDAMVQNQDFYKSLQIVSNNGAFTELQRRTLCKVCMMSEGKMTLHNVILRDEKQKSKAE